MTREEIEKSVYYRRGVLELKIFISLPKDIRDTMDSDKYKALEKFVEILIPEEDNRKEQIDKAFGKCAYENDITKPFYAFRNGAQWADSHPKENGVEMWIAREANDNTLGLWTVKPEKSWYDGPIWAPNETYNRNIDGYCAMIINSNLFPEVTYENSPQRVKLTLIK